MHEDLPDEVRDALKVSVLVIKGQPRSHVEAALVLAKALQTLAMHHVRGRDVGRRWHRRALVAEASLARLEGRDRENPRPSRIDAALDAISAAHPATATDAELNAVAERVPTVESHHVRTAARIACSAFKVGDRVRIPLENEADARGYVVAPDKVEYAGVIVQLVGEATPRLFRRVDLVADPETHGREEDVRRETIEVCIAWVKKFGPAHVDLMRQELAAEFTSLRPGKS